MTAQAELIPPSARSTRCTWSAQERAEWVELFDKSGQTAAEFCRDNDLSTTTLALWRAQSKDPTERAELEAAAFIEVPVSRFSGAQAASGSGPAVTVRLSGGTQLEVIPGTDPSWLAHLLHALQA